MGTEVIKSLTRIFSVGEGPVWLTTRECVRKPASWPPKPHADALEELMLLMNNLLFS